LLYLPWAILFESIHFLISPELTSLRKLPNHLKPPHTSDYTILCRVVCALWLQHLITRLGSVMTKIAQIFCTREDVLGKIICFYLKQLCDQNPPMSDDDLNHTLTEVWVRAHFSKFNRKSIAAGSVGQVHEGNLKDEKQTPVIIKIRRRNVVMDVHAMFTIMQIFAPLIRYFKIPVLHKLDLENKLVQTRVALVKQLNFQEEITNQMYFREMFQYHPKIVIPEVFQKICRENVIVMQKLEGVTLNRMEDFQILKDHDLHRDFAGFQLRSVYMLGRFHADPHPGNVMYLPQEQKIGVIDFGLCGSMTESEKDQQRHYIELLSSKKYHEASIWMVDHMFTPYNEALFRETRNNPPLWNSILEQISTNMEKTMGGQTISFQKFAGFVCPFLYDYGLIGDGAFLVFQLALFSTEGLIGQVFPGCNLWDLFAEIADTLGWKMRILPEDGSKQKDSLIASTPTSTEFNFTQLTQQQLADDIEEDGE